MSPATERLPPSTGLPALDAALRGLRDGDNVVWQVEAVEDYLPLVRPFAARAAADGRKVVYFRFARHAPLLEAGGGVEVHALSPAVGFDRFASAIHAVIERTGPGAAYVFDALSELAADWYSDLMLGNFFMVTCPYLYELETVTYFALLRDRHSQEAVDAIRSTTQLLVDVFRHRGATYVHPLKVQGRQSPTMYLPHLREGDAFRAITESAVLSEALSEIAEARLEGAGRPDVWDRRFQDARLTLDAAREGSLPWSAEREAFQGLLRMMLTRDERFAALAERYVDLHDLFAIRRRMIGTGLVGGKAAGMLVARAILARTDPAWPRRLEPHDSWFVGSDVFYTYLVRNGLWHARRAASSGGAGAEDGAAAARARILEGAFPPFVVRQLEAMLDFYGQSPIIVRSSSLLEDGYGNAFTGKYESVFCANQGSPEERREALLQAIRTVYASTLSEEALRYRERRGLADRDEQMAVLVQRVSGGVHGRLFFPQVAGVALSYNPYVWNHAIDPRAGVVRLVFGLGTRAVERSDDDYTRVVALNAPALRPETTLDEVTEYAQRRVDVLDLEAREQLSLPLEEVMAQGPGLPMERFGVRRPGAGFVLTFEELLWATPLVGWLRELLQALAAAYGSQVDVEFTGNFLEGGDLRLNLVQCRPLQVREGGAAEPPPRGLPPGDVLLSSRGPVVGRSARSPVDRVVYVDPDAYARLGTSDRYEVARVVGRAMRHPDARGLRVLLVGPGRWGTTTPALGVPVSFAEIQRASAVCEVMKIGEVVPDVSLGSHFFNDLVEEDMLYVALFPAYPGHVLDEAGLRAAPSALAAMLPDDAPMASVVHVVDFPLPGGRPLWLHASCVDQEVVCHLGGPPGAASTQGGNGEG
jgi:hypothetical protein